MRIAAILLLLAACDDDDAPAVDDAGLAAFPDGGSAPACVAGTETGGACADRGFCEIDECPTIRLCWCDGETWSCRASDACEVGGSCVLPGPSCFGDPPQGGFCFCEGGYVSCHPCPDAGA